METRVNVNIPKVLFQEASQLVKNGQFSSFSEIVREGLRKEVFLYKKESFLDEDERKLFSLLKRADEEGLLISEKEMERHGLKFSA